MITPTKPGFLPLAGLTVLELKGRGEASACTNLLASLGATVFAVEDAAEHSDRTRRMAGKLPIAADDPIVPRLAERCDVIVLSSDVAAPAFEPAATTVVCDITAYGRGGPLAGQADSEALVQARAGIADTTGAPNGAPSLTGAPFVGMETAVYAASAILAALHHRERTGRGQAIDMSLYDVAVNALLTFLPLVFTGRPASRVGNRHPTLAPWNSYRAADGWILICAPTNDQWRRLCEIMDRPELIDDTAFRTPSLRFEHRAQLDDVVSGWTASRTVADCTDLIGAGGIPCGPIRELPDLVDDPNLRHRMSLVEIADGVMLCRNPIRAAGHAPPPVGSVLAPGTGRAEADALVATARLPVGHLVAEGRRALEGVRILEIGMNTVAPLACRQLGALGADVIKVEPPAGDSNRVNAPLRPDGQSYVFALSNTDKRGVLLDLRKPDDAARLWRLIDDADVVIENLKPGSLAKLGFGAAAVRAQYPGLIYCSVSGFGHDSVWPGRPALDTVVQALSGAMAATPVDGTPTKAGISISDQLGGQFGLLGILAGLWQSARMGQGVTLDIAMQDCTVWATQSAFDGPSRHPRILSCTDGWIAVEDPAHRAFPELAGLDVRTALTRCADAGFPAAAVLSVAEVVEAEQTAKRGLLVTVPTPDGSEWVVLGSPLKLEATPAEVRSAMAALGWPDPSLQAEPPGAPQRREA